MQEKLLFCGLHIILYQQEIYLANSIYSPKLDEGNMQCGFKNELIYLFWPKKPANHTWLKVTYYQLVIDNTSVVAGYWFNY
jgi:hypothetical protein